MERCRFCNNEKYREFCYDIFNNKQTNPTIPTIVELLTNLKIAENDPYTKFVCFNCFHILIIFYNYRKRILETHQLLLNKTENNQNNVEDFHKNWPRIEHSDDGQFVVYIKDSNNDCEFNSRIGGDSGDEDNQCLSTLIKDNKKITNNDNNDKNVTQNCRSSIIEDASDNNQLCSRIENEFYDKNKTVDKNYQHPNILIDNDNGTSIDDGNKRNCNNDDNDKGNQQLDKNSLCAAIIKTEIDIGETCFKIENNINDEDENNYHLSIPIDDDDDDDDDDDNNKTITNDNQISDNKNYNRYCSYIIKDESSIEEFPSIIESDSEDEDNQYPSTSVGDNEKITSIDDNDELFSRIVVGYNKNQEVDDQNKIKGNNNSDKNDVITALDKQQPGINIYRYQCLICDRQFTDRSNCKRHLLTHTEREGHHCNICGKKFARKSNLKTHLTRHTGEKPHQCQYCGRKFAQKGQLKTHLNLHTGLNPYQCYICPMKFTERERLRAHLKIHTGEKPYQCHICGKKFTQKCNLKTHFNIHTNEIFYQCNVCGKKFTQKVALKEHSSVHTGEKSYQCTVCNKRFARSCTLSRHKKNCIKKIKV